MKRFFTFAVAAALAAGFSNSAWSQGGQSGGGGASGGAGGSGGTGGSGTAGTSGAAGTAGTPGTAGATGNPGASGSPANAGAAGRTQIGVGQNQAGANAQAQGQAGFNANSPWFNDPGARQQLNLNDNQFNQLNRAYRNSLNRRNLVAGQDSGNAAARNQQQLQQRNRLNAGRGTDNAAAQRQLRQGNQTQFNGEFNSTLDQVFTDPQMRQRYDQLNRQYQGPNAFNDPQVQQQLNLTADQQRQLRRLSTQWRTQMNELRRAGRSDPGMTQQQWSAMQQQYQSQLGGILTPTQQQAWFQMTGDQYNFPVDAYRMDQDQGSNIDPPTVDEDPGLQERNVGPYGGNRQSGTGQDSVR
jgi:hypothetical protein